MASELVERNVDVLVPISPAAVQAVRSLTSTIPIVAYDLETDPIGSGLVKSLARPGGNITGVFFDFPEFSKKWLELMKEMLPRLARIGVLWDPATGFTQLRAIEAVAAIMNIELEIVEVRALTELDGAMAAASRNNVDALVMLSTPLVGGSSEPLANFAASPPGGHPVSGFCPKWRVDGLRSEHSQRLSPNGPHGCQGVAGDEARRFASRIAVQVRTCCQSQDRQDNRC
jgi:hypothetical protein